MKRILFPIFVALLVSLFAAICIMTLAGLLEAFAWSLNNFPWVYMFGWLFLSMYLMYRGLRHDKNGDSKSDSDTRNSSNVKDRNGVLVRTGIETIDAMAACNSLEGIIIGVGETWVGSSFDFQKQFPTGYDFGNDKMFPDLGDQALISPDGRRFIFIDHAMIFKSDIDKARANGTIPGVETAKRLLRSIQKVSR
jgi:hypothetical protein